MNEPKKRWPTPVRDLIAQLQAFPPDAGVGVCVHRSSLQMQEEVYPLELTVTREGNEQVAMIHVDAFTSTPAPSLRLVEDSK